MSPQHIHDVIHIIHGPEESRMPGIPAQGKGILIMHLPADDPLPPGAVLCHRKIINPHTPPFHNAHNLI